MTNILSEKDYQKFLLERLAQDNGFVIRKASNYDRLFAVDREMLLQFLNTTQPDTMEYLRKIIRPTWRTPSSASSIRRPPRPMAASSKC